MLTPEKVESRIKEIELLQEQETNLRKKSWFSSKIALLRKYGVEHPMQIPSAQKKASNKWSQKTEEELASIAKKKNEKIDYQARGKTISTSLKKRSRNQIDESNLKRKVTNLQIYGTEHVAQSDQIKDKTKETNMQRYGVIHPLQLEDKKEKQRTTNRARYGTDIPSQSETIKEKGRNTRIERYGSLSPLAIPGYKEKFIQTRMQTQLSRMKVALEHLELELLTNYTYAHDWNMRFKCIICGCEFQTCWNEVSNGRQCKCKREWGSSKAEHELAVLLRSWNFDIIENDRTCIKPFELDIYIPSHQLAIEFNGLFWHSEIYKDESYHLDKLNRCLEKNVFLIQIFEDEWLYKRSIVEDRIKNILNHSDMKRIHGRKCTIQIITPSLKNEFLNKYHLQGSDASNIALGAFLENELVSVMTFSHGSLSKGVKVKDSDIWELNRYCVKEGLIVTGIASKFVKYFIVNYTPKKIFSYADRRWSNGKLYEKIGFNFVKETRPNYWYVKEFERIHRFNLRKKPDEPKNISEFTLRQNEGYIKIWDCGHLCYEIEIS